MTPEVESALAAYREARAALQAAARAAAAACSHPALIERPYVPESLASYAQLPRRFCRLCCQMEEAWWWSDLSSVSGGPRSGQPTILRGPAQQLSVEEFDRLAFASDAYVVRGSL